MPPSTKNSPPDRSGPLKFVQIAAGPDFLYGLTVEGDVWKYVPARIEGVGAGANSYAFWTRLTDYGKDPRSTKKSKEPAGTSSTGEQEQR